MNIANEMRPKITNFIFQTISKISIIYEDTLVSKKICLVVCIRYNKYNINNMDIQNNVDPQ